MKRLKLEDFKMKNLNKADEKSTEKLLGQVLGDCHDDDDNNGGGSPQRVGYNLSTAKV